MSENMKEKTTSYRGLFIEQLQRFDTLLMGIVFVWTFFGVVVNLNGIIHVQWTETALMAWFETASGENLSTVPLWAWYVQLAFYGIMCGASGSYVLEEKEWLQ